MSWRDTLDHQTTLMDFWESSWGRRYGAKFTESIEGKAWTPAQSMSADGTFANVADWELPKLAGAEPMFVTSEVCDLIERARESFQPEALRQEDLFVPWGFVVFERGIDLYDANPPRIGLDAEERRPGTSRLRAMSWAPVRSMRVSESGDVDHTGLALTGVPEGAWGIVVTMYAHREDDPPDLVAHERKIAFAANPDGHPLLRYPLILHHYCWQGFGVDYAEMIESVQSEAPDYVIESQRDQYAFIQVFFRLMQQKIAVRWNEKPPRAARKRAERARRPVRDIIVVTLRRPKNARPDEDEASGAGYSHRFIVGGHWHTYWHGTADDRYTRQHWVSDYVKGPDEAPLLIKGRAFEWSR